ncbi:hypothetical protein SDC9_114257 [bioreactor metagenome]|uniref:Uncharacterized protein n=1 Tax=bioreactor metagenome TaxID=1076179 RepID=A0A645BPX3_9ZZZZ
MRKDGCSCNFKILKSVVIAEKQIGRLEFVHADLLNNRLVLPYSGEADEPCQKPKPLTLWERKHVEPLKRVFH